MESKRLCSNPPNWVQCIPKTLCGKKYNKIVHPSGHSRFWHFTEFTGSSSWILWACLHTHHTIIVPMQSSNLAAPGPDYTWESSAAVKTKAWNTYRELCKHTSSPAQNWRAELIFLLQITHQSTDAWIYFHWGLLESDCKNDGLLFKGYKMKKKNVLTDKVGAKLL